MMPSKSAQADELTFLYSYTLIINRSGKNLRVNTFSFSTI